MSIGFVHRDRCPVCAHESYQKLCDIAFGDERMREYLADFYHGRLPLNLLQSERYSVVSCDRCGFVYQDRILDGEGMQALYGHWVDQEASLAKKQKASEQLYRKYAAQVQTLIKMIGAPPDRVRVLDFGMGWGYWSLTARDHGLQVTGFELSERRRRHAQSSGLDVITELPPPGNHYDVVYANQVFEHLPDPLETLRQLDARLAPRGLVYIRVPDGRGVADTLSWRGWIPELDAIHPLEHINCFIRSTLIKLGSNAGLELAHPPLRLTRGNILGSLRREFDDRFITTHLYFRQSAAERATPM